MKYHIDIHKLVCTDLPLDLNFRETGSHYVRINRYKDRMAYIIDNPPDIFDINRVVSSKENISSNEAINNDTD